jgi:hypothetical protein
MHRHLHLVIAVLIALMISSYTAWCCSNGIVPGDSLFRLYGIVMMFLIVSWLVADPALPATRRPSFDHGMLVWVGFPFLAAYHMYAAHRWRGILNVVGLLALFFAPYLSSAIVESLQ